MDYEKFAVKSRVTDPSLAERAVRNFKLHALGYSCESVYGLIFHFVQPYVLVIGSGMRWFARHNVGNIFVNMLQDAILQQVCTV